MMPCEVADMRDALMDEFCIDETRALKMAWKFYRLFHPDA